MRTTLTSCKLQHVPRHRLAYSNRFRCLPQDGWLDVARQRIQQRMQQYSEGEIRFNLMALIRDRRAVATEQLAATARAEQLQVSRQSSSDPDPCC